jgi:hypothetical protein
MGAISQSALYYWGYVLTVSGVSNWRPLLLFFFIPLLLLHFHLLTRSWPYDFFILTYLPSSQGPKYHGERRHTTMTTKDANNTPLYTTHLLTLFNDTHTTRYLKSESPWATTSKQLRNAIHESSPRMSYEFITSTTSIYPTQHNIAPNCLYCLPTSRLLSCADLPSSDIRMTA